MTIASKMKDAPVDFRISRFETKPGSDYMTGGIDIGDHANAIEIHGRDEAQIFARFAAFQSAANDKIRRVLNRAHSVLMVCRDLQQIIDPKLESNHGRILDAATEETAYALAVTTIQSDDEAWLVDHGYAIAPRHPAIKPEFPGDWMVYDPADGEDGFCIVGNDREELIKEARIHLDSDHIDNETA